MTLRDALHAARTLPWSAMSADPMVASVLRWRREVPDELRALCQAANVPEPTELDGRVALSVMDAIVPSGRKGRPVGHSCQTIVKALSDGHPHFLCDLSQDVGLTEDRVQQFVCRLRRKGFQIETGGAQGQATYRLVSAPEPIDQAARRRAIVASLPRHGCVEGIG